MGFFGSLFSTADAANKVVDTVANGLDKLVYTDEEKADAAAKERSEARSMLVDWMKTTTGQNIARRVLALSVCAVWLIDIILAQLAGVIAIFASQPTKWQDLGKFMLDSSMGMNNIVMLVFAFYFAAPHMGSIAEAVVAKFTKGVQ